MALFDYAWKFTLAHEGGLTEDKNDPGGITKWGVDFRMLSGLAKKQKMKAMLIENGVRLPVTRETIKALTKAQAAAIYRAVVWEPLACWRYADPIAMVLFDAGVISGNQQSVILVQRAWNGRHPRATQLAVDGIIGPKTTQAILTDEALPLAARAIDERLAFHIRLVEQKPKLKAFLPGWKNRVRDLRKYLGL